MKAEDVNFFEKVRSQLQQFQTEISLLSKSKPDNPINKFKLSFINEKLLEANTILVGDFKPFKDFTVFNVDDVPSNSDVVMVLSQYLDCLEAWRSANIRYVPSVGWCWITSGNDRIETVPPSRFRKM